MSSPSFRRKHVPARHIAFLVFAGFDFSHLHTLLEAFRLAGKQYRLSVMSLDGGDVPSACGLTMASRPVTADGLDTLIIVDGAPIPLLAELADYACAAAALVRRIAGIGAGAFVLAEAGLLNGKRAAIAPQQSEVFARTYPKVRLDRSRTFVNDHGVWTASGAAPAIELCLGLIEEDWGAEVCRAIAPSLPVDKAKSRYAAPAGRQMGIAEAVERRKSEIARRQIEEGSRSFAAIAQAAGFKHAEDMRRNFLRLFGQPPQILRRAARQGRRITQRHKPQAAE